MLVFNQDILLWRESAVNMLIYTTSISNLSLLLHSVEVFWFLYIFLFFSFLVFWKRLPFGSAAKLVKCSLYDFLFFYDSDITVLNDLIWVSNLGFLWYLVGSGFYVLFLFAALVSEDDSGRALMLRLSRQVVLGKHRRRKETTERKKERKKERKTGRQTEGRKE